MRNLPQGLDANRDAIAMAKVLPTTHCSWMPTPSNAKGRHARSSSVSGWGRGVVGAGVVAHGEGGGETLHRHALLGVAGKGPRRRWTIHPPGCTSQAGFQSFIARPAVTASGAALAQQVALAAQWARSVGASQHTLSLGCAACDAPGLRMFLDHQGCCVEEAPGCQYRPHHAGCRAMWPHVMQPTVAASGSPQGNHPTIFPCSAPKASTGVMTLSSFTPSGEQSGPLGVPPGPDRLSPDTRAGASHVHHHVHQHEHEHVQRRMIWLRPRRYTIGHHPHAATAHGGAHGPSRLRPPPPKRHTFAALLEAYGPGSRQSHCQQ